MRIVKAWTELVPLRTRLPFRYGIATMTQVDHLFMHVRLETQNGTFDGIAADHLPPRWFRKDATVTLEDEQAELRAVVESAATQASAIGIFASPFTAWQELWKAQAACAATRAWPPLLAHFGTSLVERALLDAFARSRQQPLHELILADSLGLDLGLLEPALAGSRAADWLPGKPLETVTVRHTVGMLDPLTKDQVRDAPGDALPISLAENICTYGLRRFKLKLSGVAEADLDRLRHTAAVIEEHAPQDFGFSLDGNEQFKEADTLREFGEKAFADPLLRNFFTHLIFIEQPFPRSLADVSPRGAWPSPVPVLLDEGDGDLPDLPRALDLGYAGVSHKNCKGIFKGLRNACLIRARASREPERPWLTSGEDLANVGPVALTQDLAMQALLGNGDVERNGHHYFAGLSGFSPKIARAAAEAHPDLFAADATLGARLRITGGCIQLQSVNRAPFGWAGSQYA